jgi:hypothetical protein
VTIDSDDPSGADQSGVPVKSVGRRRPGTTLDIRHDTKENARAWRRSLPTPFVPKGVYRFSSHEAADAWLWKMITRKPKS